MRVGRVKTDFNSSHFGVNGGVNGHYDSSSLYYGAHVGLEYQWHIADDLRLDLKSNYLWTHTNGDDITNNHDEKIRFDSIDSQRLRTGITANYLLMEQLTLIAGAAYEYEFMGKGQGVIDGLKIDEPATKGGSGVGELGVRYSPNIDSPLSASIKIQGYIGKREGLLGSIQVKYAF